MHSCNVRWRRLLLCGVAASFMAAAAVVDVRSRLLPERANGVVCVDVGREPDRLVVHAYNGYLIVASQPMKCDLIVRRLYLGRRLTVAPIWPFTFGAAMVLGIGSVLAVRCALRRSWGLCGRCGYDLRETPERCPECGMFQIA